MAQLYLNSMPLACGDGLYCLVLPRLSNIFTVRTLHNSNYSASLAASLILEPGSCTILIANLHDLPRERLPLFAQRAYPATALASYPDIFDAVDSAMTSCMESAKMERRLGWAVQGRLPPTGEFDSCSAAHPFRLVCLRALTCA